jgi:hypothetical protein
MKRSTRFLVAAAAALLSACANAPHEDPIYGPSATRVLVQVCYPTLKIDFEQVAVNLEYLPAQFRGEHPSFQVYDARQVAQADREVRLAHPPWAPNGPQEKWILGDAVYRTSWTGLMMSLVDNTTSNQPVVQESLGRRPGEIKALSVWVGKGDDRIDYWFVLPDSVPSGQFTQWTMPASQIGPNQRRRGEMSVGYDMVHGAPLPLHPVSPDAPRMRFMLSSNREFYDDLDRSMPARLAAEAQLAATSRDVPLHRIVPASRGTIPGC